MTIRLLGLLAVGAAGWLAAAGWTVARAQTNAAAADKDPAADIAKLTRRAETLEQAGQKFKAAQVYEAIARRNPSERRPLAIRLARLYAECGVTNKAVQWAGEVMKVHPDPRVFLAGIQTRLGDYPEAAKLLEGEIRVAPSRQRRMMLLWQAAQVYDKQGNAAAARRALEQAVAAATNSQERDAASKRLEKFIEEQKVKVTAAPKPALPVVTNKPALAPKAGPTAPRR
jgi:tetratricopeptide (TPR) repeat protein